MTTQAVSTRPGMLAHRRFAVRFLGRPGTWLWLAATGGGAAAAWLLVARPAHGSPEAQRTWFLWSGNVLLALFVATMLFVARKWSVKLKWARDYGRAPPESADAAWSELQQLNAKIRQGAYASDAEILAAANATLERWGVRRTQRVRIVTAQAGGREVKFVQAVKNEPFGRLEAWLEMHMGVGTVACLAVLLHADLVLRDPLGWTLFVLSMVVLATGVLGAVLYRAVPAKLVEADLGIPYEEAGVAREAYQECVAGIVATLDDAARADLSPLLVPARSPAVGRDRGRAVLEQVRAARPDRADLARELVVMAGSRDRIAENTARARRLDLLLKLWRWIHVPVSVALFFAIALHVIAVVWY